MVRYLFLSHRYLGIGIGWLMALWCLSGIVMMYVSYPRLDEGSRIENLPILNDFSESTWPQLTLSDLDEIHGLTVEVKRGSPHLIFQLPKKQHRVFSFEHVLARPDVNVLEATTEAKRYVDNPRFLEKITHDQWTVYSSYHAHRPLYKFGTDDAEGSIVYISSKTGQLVQHTTFYQRFWNYFGAITHWLYPTFIREHSSFWYYLVIVVSLIGSILCITGFYFGIKQLKRRKNGRLSPYKGISWWHHWAGLSFGVLLFVWTLSGLLSMNPAGLLESSGSAKAKTEMGQLPLRWGVIENKLQPMQWNKLPKNTVKLELVSLNENLYWLATTNSQESYRLDVHLNTEPLSSMTVDSLARDIAQQDAYELTWLAEEDTYYFSHHKPISLPVWRIILEDEEQTRFYLSVDDGRILQKVDKNGRLHRWLFDAAHRWDFSKTLRKRPVWDLVLVPILLLTTLFVGTGCWIGVKRLRMMNRKRKKKQKGNPARLTKEDAFARQDGI